MPIDVKPERRVPPVQPVAGDASGRFRMAGDPAGQVGHHLSALERGHHEHHDPRVDRGHGCERDPRYARRPPAANVGAPGDERSAERDERRDDDGGGRQLQPRNEEISSRHADRDEQRTNQPQSNARSSVVRRRRKGAQIAPRATAEETERRRRRKHVVIELERRKRKEADNGDDPGPEQDFDAVALVTCDGGPHIVNEAADHEARPWQQARRKNLKIEPELNGTTEPVHRVQLDVFVDEISGHELVAEADVHVDEPWRRNREDDPQPRDPAKSKQTAAHVPRHRHRQPHRQAAENERERTFRQHGTRDQDVPRILQHGSVSQRGDGDKRHSAKEKHREEHIEDGVAREPEQAWTRRKNQPGDNAGVDRDERRANPSRDEHKRERRHRGHDAGAKLGRAEDEHRRCLKLVKEDWLIEEGLLVVVRRPPVARRDDLARCFCVMRFVGIPERRRSEAPEHDDEEQDRGSSHSGRSRQRRRFSTLPRPRHARVYLSFEAGA